MEIKKINRNFIKKIIELIKMKDRRVPLKNAVSNKLHNQVQNLSNYPLRTKIKIFLRSNIHYKIFLLFTFDSGKKI